MMMRATALLFVLSMLLAGCSSLPTQSHVATDQQYDGFLAYAAFSDLGVEGAFEKAICQRLQSQGHACRTMLEEVPPVVPGDQVDYYQAALASGAQAVVFIELADMDSQSRQVLANGQPAYRVSLLDTQTRAVVARFAVEGRPGRQQPRERGQALARAVTQALEQQHLLK